MLQFKEQLVKLCKTHLDHKLNELNEVLKDVTEAGNNETKSTVGDKHETGRAMMQLEQEKLGKQLREAEIQLAEFERINFKLDSSKIILGSLIETNRGLFLMATSIGKINLDSKTIFVVSPQSPIGKVLLGKKQKDTMSFNGVSYEIWNVA